MKKYQKIFVGITLSLFVFGFAGVKTAKAITIEEIKAQIIIILAKVAEIQRQLQELIANEAKPLPKSITLISPDGGEKWEPGKTYNITWNSSGYASDSKVQIKLLDDRYGQNLPASELNVAQTQNNGLYSWKMPDVLDGRGLYGSLYKIAVDIEERNDKLSDVSNGYFIISQSIPAYLNLIYPNGGEVLETGKTYVIKWDSLGMENYKATLTLKKSEMIYSIIADNILKNSSYNWKVSQDLYGSDYKILINVYDNSGNLMSYDVSNNNFTIIRAASSKSIEQQLAAIAQAVVNLLQKAKEFIAR